MFSLLLGHGQYIVDSHMTSLCSIACYKSHDFSVSQLVGQVESAVYKILVSPFEKEAVQIQFSNSQARNSKATCNKSGLYIAVNSKYVMLFCDRERARDKSRCNIST